MTRKIGNPVEEIDLINHWRWLEASDFNKTGAGLQATSRKLQATSLKLDKKVL
jgi:hypothetical protein